MNKKRPITASGRRKVFKRAEKQAMRRAVERQVVENADVLTVDIQMMTPGWSKSTESVLKMQMNRLRARHMFISERCSARRIAQELEVEPSEVFDWVDLYGWQEMRKLREIQRTRRFQHTRETNAFHIEQQTDQLMSKIALVASDLLDMHFNEGEMLSPSDLKSLADVVEKTFTVRGALKGSEKVGEKLKVELSGEVQHSFNEMLKHITAVPKPQRKLPTDQRLAITVEDEQFSRTEKA